VIAFLVNPHSAGGRGQKLFEKSIAALRDKKIITEEIVTFASGDLPAVENWAAECFSKNINRFAAAGGDGTVNLLLNALMNRRLLKDASVGALGIGSSNDFHKPVKSKIGSVPYKLDFNNTVLSDVAVAEMSGTENNSPSVRRAFIVNSSVGITSDANYYFNNPDAILGALKSFWTGAAINWAALRTIARYKRRDVEITGPSGTKHLQLSNLGVIKRAYFSGSFHYDKAPLVDDGKLWVHIAYDMSLFELLKTTMALSSGKFSGRAKTTSFAADRFELRSLDGDLSVELDGEVFRASKINWSVMPKMLRVCV
jgi:diacylglycerol kinase (ATP)